MMKRLLILAMAAGMFAGSSAAAEAGALRKVLRGGKELVGIGLLMTRCTLKGKPGQILC